MVFSLMKRCLITFVLLTSFFGSTLVFSDVPQNLGVNANDSYSLDSGGDYYGSYTGVLNDDPYGKGNGNVSINGAKKKNQKEFGLQLPTSFGFTFGRNGTCSDQLRVVLRKYVATAEYPFPVYSYDSNSVNPFAHDPSLTQADAYGLLEEFYKSNGSQNVIDINRELEQIANSDGSIEFCRVDSVVLVPLDSSTDSGVNTGKSEIKMELCNTEKLKTQKGAGTDCLYSDSVAFSSENCGEFDAVCAVQKNLDDLTDGLGGLIITTIAFFMAFLAVFVAMMLQFFLWVLATLGDTFLFMNPASDTYFSISQLLFSFMAQIANILIIAYMVYEGIRFAWGIGAKANFGDFLARLALTALGVQFSFYAVAAVIALSYEIGWIFVQAIDPGLVNPFTAFFDVMVRGITYTNVDGQTNGNAFFSAMSSLRESFSSNARVLTGTNDITNNMVSFALRYWVLAAVLGFALMTFLKIIRFLVARVAIMFFLLISAPIGYVLWISGSDIFKTWGNKWFKLLGTYTISFPFIAVMLALGAKVVQEVDVAVSGVARSINQGLASQGNNGLFGGNGLDVVISGMMEFVIPAVMAIGVLMIIDGFVQSELNGMAGQILDQGVKAAKGVWNAPKQMYQKGKGVYDETSKRAVQASRVGGAARAMTYGGVKNAIGKMKENKSGEALGEIFNPSRIAARTSGGWKAGEDWATDRNALSRTIRQRLQNTAGDAAGERAQEAMRTQAELRLRGDNEVNIARADQIVRENGLESVARQFMGKGRSGLQAMTISGSDEELDNLVKSGMDRARVQGRAKALGVERGEEYFSQNARSVGGYLNSISHLEGGAYETALEEKFRDMSSTQDMEWTELITNIDKVEGDLRSNPSLRKAMSSKYMNKNLSEGKYNADVQKVDKYYGHNIDLFRGVEDGVNTDRGGIRDDKVKREFKRVMESKTENIDRDVFVGNYDSIKKAQEQSLLNDEVEQGAFDETMGFAFRMVGGNWQDNIDDILGRLDSKQEWDAATGAFKVDASGAPMMKSDADLAVDKQKADVIRNIAGSYVSSTNPALSSSLRREAGLDTFDPANPLADGSDSRKAFLNNLGFEGKSDRVYDGTGALKSINSIKSTLNPSEIGEGEIMFNEFRNLTEKDVEERLGRMLKSIDEMDDSDKATKADRDAELMKSFSGGDIDLLRDFEKGVAGDITEKKISNNGVVNSDITDSYINQLAGRQKRGEADALEISRGVARNNFSSDEAKSALAATIHSTADTANNQIGNYNKKQAEGNKSQTQMMAEGVAGAMSAPDPGFVDFESKFKAAEAADTSGTVTSNLAATGLNHRGLWSNYNLDKDDRINAAAAQIPSLAAKIIDDPADTPADTARKKKLKDAILVAHATAPDADGNAYIIPNSAASATRSAQKKAVLMRGGMSGPEADEMISRGLSGGKVTKDDLIGLDPELVQYSQSFEGMSAREVLRTVPGRGRKTGGGQTTSSVATPTRGKVGYNSFYDFEPEKYDEDGNERVSGPSATQTTVGGDSASTPASPAPKSGGFNAMSNQATKIQQAQRSSETATETKTTTTATEKTTEQIEKIKAQTDAANQAKTAQQQSAVGGDPSSSNPQQQGTTPTSIDSLDVKNINATRSSTDSLDAGYVNTDGVNVQDLKTSNASFDSADVSGASFDKPEIKNASFDSADGVNVSVTDPDKNKQTNNNTIIDNIDELSAAASSAPVARSVADGGTKAEFEMMRKELLKMTNQVMKLGVSVESGGNTNQNKVSKQKLVNAAGKVKAYGQRAKVAGVISAPEFAQFQRAMEGALRNVNGSAAVPTKPGRTFVSGPAGQTTIKQTVQVSSNNKNTQNLQTEIRELVDKSGGRPVVNKIENIFKNKMISEVQSPTQKLANTLKSNGGRLDQQAQNQINEIQNTLKKVENEMMSIAMAENMHTSIVTNQTRSAKRAVKDTLEESGVDFSAVNAAVDMMEDGGMIE